MSPVFMGLVVDKFRSFHSEINTISFCPSILARNSEIDRIHNIKDILMIYNSLFIKVTWVYTALN